MQSFMHINLAYFEARRGSLSLSLIRLLYINVLLIGQGLGLRTGELASWFTGSKAKLFQSKCSELTGAAKDGLLPVDNRMLITNINNINVY